VLKGFEKKESNMASAAATNLSFMFVLENDLGQAEKYAEMAMASDRYNPLGIT
jgi:intraflagellar transport protein 88